MAWLEALGRQLNVIWDAPGPFLMLWAILTYASYRFVRHHYSERLTNMEGRLSLRDDELSHLKDKMRSSPQAVVTGVGSLGAFSLVAPAAPVRPATHSVRTDSGTKEILDRSITPQQLMALCRDKTGLQASALTDGYIGKWIHIEGSLSNVSGRDNQAAFASVDVPGVDGSSYRPTLWLSFSRPTPALAGFARGDPVRAIGRIQKIHELSMDLEDCELVV